MEKETRTQYENLVISAILVNGGAPFPNSGNDLPHFKYEVRVLNALNKKKIMFDFYTSRNDFKRNNRTIPPIELLNVFECFIIESMIGGESYEEYVSSFGDESKYSEKIYKGCVKQYNKWEKLGMGQDIYDFYNKLKNNLNN